VCSMTTLWNSIRDGVLLREGSTRAVGLLRIGLALRTWHRFGDTVAPWADNVAPDRLALAAAFYLSTTLMLVGLFSRFATAATAATLLVMYFHYGLNGETQWFEHHTYLLMSEVTLLALTPCGRSYSLDRWIALSRGRALEESGPLWAVPLLALQTSAVYFWGAYDKCEPAFLHGERFEHYVMNYYWGSDYPQWAGFHPLMVAMAVGTVALEYMLSVGLFVRPLQKWLMPVGMALHAAMYVYLPVKAFSALMWVLYLAYLPPEVVHRALDRIQARPG
jgi:hypothetical protein